MPKDLQTALHDRIDSREELLDRTKAAVENTIKNKIDDALAQAGHDIEGALEILAMLVGNEIADITTDAAKVGFEHGREMGRK